MYVAKHTMLYHHKVHDGQATVFYMDVRAAGKVVSVRTKVGDRVKRGQVLGLCGNSGNSTVPPSARNSTAPTPQR